MMKLIVSFTACLMTLCGIMTIQVPDKDCKVLFIGDSITDGGWGRSGGSMAPSEERNQKDPNHIFGHGYMEMCAAHFQSTYPQRDFHFFNRGISGNTLSDLTQRWDKDALALHPDVVSILVGTNDADTYLNAHTSEPLDDQKWKEEYRGLLHTLRQQNPNVIIVLGTPFVAKAGRIGQRDDYAARERIVARLAQAVRQLAQEENVICIPFDELFSDLQQEAIRPDYWIWDGIHPTTAGHRRMADLWIRLMEGVLTQD